MLGPSHRVAGVAAWAGVAYTTHLTGAAAATGALIAGATAHGRMSPDMDRYPLLTKIVPGGHRGITHFWPVLALFAVGAQAAGDAWWAVAAVGVAWASHIVTDGVFGRIPVWRRNGRWLYRGLRFKTGGRVEQWLAVPVFVLAGLWCGWLIAQPHAAAVLAR